MVSSQGVCWCVSVGKLLEMHGEGSSTTQGKASEVGERVDRPDSYEPPVLSSV